MSLSDVLAALSKRIQFIVGPTGTGKTGLALSVVQELQPMILNADSVQFYKRVQIGANKPSAEERSRCPHELFDCVDYPEEATASDYLEKALGVLKSHKDQSEFLLVGGSGFYIQALEKGMYEVDPISEEVLNQVRELELAGKAREKLEELDPEAAGRIHPNDHYRVQRALQIVLSEGRSMKEVQEEKAQNESSPLEGYKVHKVGLYLEREELRSLVEKRTGKMLDSGLLEEAKSILAKTSEDWAPMRSIGYAECVQVLKGSLAEAELAPLIVKNTMALAKKQLTWFKRDPEIQWFHAFTQLQEARDSLIMAQ